MIDSYVPDRVPLDLVVLGQVELSVLARVSDLEGYGLVSYRVQYTRYTRPGGTS